MSDVETLQRPLQQFARGLGSALSEIELGKLEPDVLVGTVSAYQAAVQLLSLLMTNMVNVNFYKVESLCRN